MYAQRPINIYETAEGTHTPKSDNRIRVDTDLGDVEKNKLNFNMERLKRELQNLGETFLVCP